MTSSRPYLIRALYEWISDNVFGTNTQPTITDTIKDLILGMIGGVTYIVYLSLTRPARYFVKTYDREVSAVRAEG